MLQVALGHIQTAVRDRATAGRNSGRRWLLSRHHVLLWYHNMFLRVLNDDPSLIISLLLRTGSVGVKMQGYCGLAVVMAHHWQFRQIAQVDGCGIQ